MRFFRNTVLNANDFFLKQTELQAAQPNKEGAMDQNQYGGVIGGPVKKDKLFFFISYQQTSQKNGFAQQGNTTGIGLPPLPNLAAGRGTCPSGQVTIAQMEANCDAATQAFVSALGARVCRANYDPLGAGVPGAGENRPLHNTYANSTVPNAPLTAGVDVNCSGNNISPQAIQILQLTTSQWPILRS